MKTNRKITITAIAICMLVLGLFLSPVLSTTNSAKAKVKKKSNICTHWEPAVQNCILPKWNCCSSRQEHYPRIANKLN